MESKLPFILLKLLRVDSGFMLTDFCYEITSEHYIVAPLMKSRRIACELSLTELIISAILLRYPASLRLAIDVKDLLDRMEARTEFLRSKRSICRCFDLVYQNTRMNTMRTKARIDATIAPIVTESVVQASGEILTLGSKDRSKYQSLVTRNNLIK